MNTEKTAKELRELNELWEKLAGEHRPLTTHLPSRSERRGRAPKVKRGKVYRPHAKDGG